MWYKKRCTQLTDLKTQNTVLHIMHFLRPQVAKAPCIFESQLISSNSTVTSTFLYSINISTFLLFLCFFVLVAFIFSYVLFSFYCIFQKQLPSKKGIPTRKIDLIKSNFLKLSAFHWRNTEVFFCCILWVTLDDLYTYEAKDNIELLIPGLGLPLRKAVSSS